MTSRFQRAHSKLILTALSLGVAFCCQSAFADESSADSKSAVNQAADKSADSADHSSDITDNAADSSDSSKNKSDDSEKGGSGKDDRRFAKDLSQFEMRFFEKKFPDETDTQRLDRIERLVYGKRQEGDNLDRVKRLLRDVPHLGDGLPKADKDLAEPDKKKAADDKKAAKRSSNPDETGTDANNQSTDSIPVAEETPVTTFSSPYQTRSLVNEVGNMEQQLYGKQYVADTLIDRVKRLEGSVFAGQTPQTFMPITMRINRLSMALQPKFSAPTSVYTTPSANENTTTAYPATAPSYSTSQLPVKENPIPNQSYSYNSNYDYSGGKNPYGNSTYDAGNFSNATATNTSKEEEKPKTKGHPFLHKLGHFIGEVGEAAAVTAGSIAAGSMMGYGYGGYGMGYPGYGYGYGMPYGYGGRPFMGYW